MKKVFVIEKDQFSCDMLAESLLLLNYSPVLIKSIQNLGLEFIEADPDIVIINQNLFVLNKHLFVHNKKRLSKACIILTSNTLSDPSKIKELGADLFILKPYDLKTLSDVLLRSNILEKKRVTA